MGFNLHTRVRLRLRGINAPEKKTTAGYNAIEYVKERLNGLEFIIVRTQKTGKYGRYIADIFYSHDETCPDRVAKYGTYLNQELVENGFAEMYDGTG